MIQWVRVWCTVGEIEQEDAEYQPRALVLAADLE